eukprot:102645_1
MPMINGVWVDDEEGGCLNPWWCDSSDDCGDCTCDDAWWPKCKTDSSSASPNPLLDILHIVIGALLLSIIINIILCWYIACYKKCCCKQTHPKHQSTQKIKEISTDIEHAHLISDIE